jgi:hypothetical protein
MLLNGGGKLLYDKHLVSVMLSIWFEQQTLLNGSGKLLYDKQLVSVMIRI